MTIKDMQEYDNILLDRKELNFILFHPGEPTPTRQRIRNMIAAQYAVDLDLIYVYKLAPEFGRGSTKCKVMIYKSKNAAENLIPKHIKKRNEIKEGKGDSDSS
ncbi:MAG: 30S ribosomal protein S24e [Candidatus Helarchaeota archaeon]